jgi:hypothetical protein
MPTIFEKDVVWFEDCGRVFHGCGGLTTVRRRRGDGLPQGLKPRSWMMSQSAWAKAQAYLEAKCEAGSTMPRWGANPLMTMELS